MLYLVTQIIVTLAAAALLGLAVGWWIHRVRSEALGEDREAALADAERELVRLEAELRQTRARSHTLRSDLDAKQRELAELASRQPADEIAARLEAERVSHEQTRRRLDELTSVHADCDFAFEALRIKILMLRDEVNELKRERQARVAPD